MNVVSPEALQAIMNITPESLAGHCGLIGDQTDIDDSVRTARLKQQLGVLQATPSTQTEKVYYEFAAKYLPDLVTLYREKATPTNSSMTMLNVIAHTSYFVRFQRTEAGSDLASLVAGRIANAETDTTDADVVGEMCQLLSTLLVFQGAASVSAEDQAKLLPKFRRWRRAYAGRLASETSERCLGTFTGDFMIQQMSRSIKSMLEQPLDQCGANCSRRVQSGGSELMQCSRCKTAVYCGAAHQREAWATHKPLCYPPAF
ncbi:hypothetical protein BV22DRAFT_1024840 [Leucogyrophana mollusca]|uniref:Uncharacterized protein n=1 Tax=Leucogyrophana mollusca TaxID=85980 RepID=A0ACB8AYF2_9AGAM|nr:hypothetical protein BV22DRAFT_1024840 [Leucogyrophana mollusca]